MDRKKMNTSREVSESRKKLSLVPSRPSLARSAGIPANEQDRLAALHAYRILDTDNEHAYDDLVKLASDLFGVPIARISLVDEKRQFIKASVGLPRADAPREHSFCAHAVFDNTPLVVLDSLRDPRFLTNPMVTGDPEIRFYAGFPLRVGKGLPLGSFCLIDRKPRLSFSDAEIFSLEQFANLASALIERRAKDPSFPSKSGEIGETERGGPMTEQASFDCVWEFDCLTSDLSASERCLTLVGLPEGKAPLSLSDWMGRFHPRDFQRLHGDWKDAVAEHRQDFYAELRCLHASGRWVWLMLRARCSYALTGNLLKVTGTACDISHRMTADQLTGMDNRDSLVDQLQSRIDRASIEPKNFAVYFLDLDKFKLINESLGHAVGDQLLVQVADRLMSTVEGTAGCIAARVGGDEFAILVSDLAQETDAVTFGTLLSHVIAMPFYCDGQLIHTSVSVGVSFGSSRHETTAERMLEEADIAMYQAKKQGKGCQVLFRSNMKLAAVERLTIERDLRLAIENEQIEVYYQPKIGLDSDRLVGLEALVRWRHPERGLLSPVSFIDIAEETGLISMIGMLVARQAISQLSAWIKNKVVAPSTTVAINLSAKQMRQPHLWDKFQEMCNEVNLPYGNVIIEITESVFIDNSEAVADVLQQCVNIGFGLDLDDFGTGYSSLSYLHRFPFQNVKVDRSFVSQMICDSKSRGVVGSIIHLARSLGMGVVAEGIETPEQSARLQRMGCKVGQGYLFSRPVSAALFENMMSIQALHPPLGKASLITGSFPI